MTAQLLSLPNDPYAKLIAVAHHMERDDLSTDSQLGARFADAVVEMVGRGVVPLPVLSSFALSGHDSGRLFEALRARLDNLADRGLPSLEVTAADYLRQLGVDRPEATALSEVCRACDQLTAESPDEQRRFHEILHLGFITSFSMFDHQGVEADENLASMVSMAALIRLASVEHLSSLIEDGRLSQEATAIAESLGDIQVKSELRDSFDDLEESAQTDQQRHQLVATALAFDALDLQGAGCLSGSGFGVIDPITVGVELLVPYESRDLLAGVFENDADHEDRLYGVGVP